MAKQPKLPGPPLLIFVFTSIIIIISANYNSVNSDSVASQLIFGCMKIGQSVRCDPATNKFNSVTITGHVQRIFTLNMTEFSPVEGVFGNALSIHSYRQQYLSLPNQVVTNPSVFSVSFWMKQDPDFRGNSSVISHINSAKTAGWYVESFVVNSQSHVQFSVANSDGEAFSVSSPIDPGIFQNVIGIFDGKMVKIYLNGYLVNTVAFIGDFDPDPNVPLNVGLNAYDFGRPWNGVIDEFRLYKKVISDKEMQKLTDYGNYFQTAASSQKDDGLVGYWPFERGTEDKSGNSKDGKMIVPAVSMAFSPDRRLFVSVRDAGEIRIMNQNLTPVEEPFVRLQDPSTNVTQEILGIALDPRFPTNHYVYSYVTATDGNSGNNVNRVLRFTEINNKATNQKILIDNIPVAGKGLLFAGALAFGPDNKLYIGTGYSSQIEQGQNADLSGKVLRINRDGTIPQDNPFPNSPVYALGHRNLFGIGFAKGTGSAVIAENGASHHDEINVLEKGGNYGYPSIEWQQSASGAKLIRTDNSSAIQPARTYYKPIIPTQMIFYDGNRFRDLKGMFLVPSYGEGSVYALSFNKTGSLVEEFVIRLPEVRGHIISIAGSPNGDIYLAGESMYKLTSLDTNRATLTYFLDIVRNNSNILIDDISLNLSTKVLSVDVSNRNANTNIEDNGGNTSAASPSLQVAIPKTLLGTISEVTSENYNKTANNTDKVVEKFKTKETRRITNVGDTIIDVQLNDNVGTDKILIKGQTSTLVQPPSRNIEIRR